MHAVLAATANPEHPNQVDVARPSDALVARAEAKSALNGLFLGLGAVSLLVGAIGVANIMVISVLERRSEIGLRRALGATKGHIRVQFLAEAMLLALVGGAPASPPARPPPPSTPNQALGDRHPDARLGRRLAAAILIGAVAGLLPALRAARCPRPKRSGPFSWVLLAASGPLPRDWATTSAFDTGVGNVPC